MGQFSVTCLPTVTLKIFVTVDYAAECYMIRHLPGQTVRAALRSREDLWGYAPTLFTSYYYTSVSVEDIIDKFAQCSESLRRQLV